MIPNEVAALSFTLIGIGYAICFKRIEYIDMRPKGPLTKLVALPVGNLFLTMFLLCAVVALLGNSAGATLTQVSLASNTLYQNNASSELVIYSSSIYAYSGYEGANQLALNLILNNTPASGLNVLANNDTETMVVPYGLYYLFKYSTTPTFYVLNET